MNQLKQKTLSGFFYKLAEQGASQAVGFLVQIILARILMPEEFGTVALLTVLMTILDVFVTYGFGNSLVVNKKSDDLDFSTCFYFGISLSIVFYIIIYFSSPYISTFFYGNDELDILVKVMALRMPVSAINSVQHAYVAKQMRFKMFFYATFIGTFLSGVISVTMAYIGFGLWALVAQDLSRAFLSTVSLWYFAKWRPKWMFSFKRLKAIYDYGWKILAVGLVDTLFSQLRSLVIAKKYTRADLAYYGRGTVFPGFGMRFIEPTISGVLFPALSNCNDDPAMMKSITQRLIKTSTYVVCGFMFLLLAIAKPLVVILLTDKWLPCVVFLQIGCVAYMLRPLQLINNCVIRASGRSALLLKLDLLKKGIGIGLLLLSMNFGVEAIAWSYVATNVISTFINIYPNKDILKYSYAEQFKDLAANMIIAALMGGIVWAFTLLPLSDWALLIIQLGLGLSIYVALSYIFKIDSYSYLISMIKEQVISKIK